MMKKKYKLTIFDVVLVIVMFLLAFIMFYPFWYVVMVSLNDNTAQSYTQIVFLPKAFTLESYRAVLSNSGIARGYMITIARTVLGTFLSVICSAMFAYGLHVKYLIGRKWILKYVVFTMFFGGGMIPSYLLLYKLGLINTFWIYIVPSLIGSWNVMMMRTYYSSSIPQGLEEAAKMDGCTELGTFFRIILPTAKPIIATIGLFIAVGHWNDWWTAEIMVSNTKIWPVQNVLRRMISSQELTQTMLQARGTKSGLMSLTTSESIRMAAVIVVTLPILIVYPFCQKYFVKGVMIGSVKE